MIDADRLRRGYETAARTLLDEATPQGHWTGELSPSPLSTATAVAALHLVASWLHAHWLEIQHDPPIDDYRNRFAIFTNAPAVDRNGEIAVPQGPGLGVEINPDLIANA